jgi:anti-sigma B factor antagonist
MLDAGFPVWETSGVRVVGAPEEIDMTNAAGLRAALLEAAERADGTLVVDMTRTRFCDTSGLRALVGAHQRAQAGSGRTLLVIPDTAVLRIVAITGIDQVIPTFATLEEALADVPVSRERPAG